ncbi:ring-1,2-phenylacetyl-CoA epoxidase subunit PaaE [Catalinimonas alkaloidigena]|uniref:Ring-1,2-phenylacetyl-CoA epoxidase subunit PaaE n=1 Tax=Catalinimonas alkaloidigena TaxID=1075417 RepID=A0A1G9KXD6_9BACT|nr:ferredoxin--NADP reductase [Catalinimonas alkaloidigena]SDL54266.1 ring-1,2-phenylacetyl-CoA epoxidase subunit PaaE [Catalinimonas alkaloidigena]
MFKKLKQLFSGERPQHHFPEVVVKRIVRETSDTISLYFDLPEGYTYKPGQFITFVLQLDGKEVRRSYSLCTSPHVDAEAGVTVKRVDGGLVSNHLNEHLKEGDRLQIMAPDGKFTLALEASNARHVVMFAGGSGITPLISLTKSVLAQEPQSRVTLVYVNRVPDAIIFRTTLDELEAIYADRLQVIHVLSRSNDLEGLTHAVAGRLSGDVLREVRARMAPRPETTEYFVCGPDGMMKTVLEELQAWGVPKTQIHRESFVTKTDEVALAAAQKQAGAAHAGRQPYVVKVILEGEEHVIEVAANQSILEAALDLNIDMPYSCQSGMCTACRGRCLSGKVYLDDVEGLSEQEMAQGYVLTCVGHPLSEDVVIEIG